MTGCTSINNLKTNDADTISDGSLTKELNVIDISTQNEYDAICGYTESEIQKYYSRHINEIMRRHDRTEEEVYIMKCSAGMMVTCLAVVPQSLLYIVPYLSCNIFN